MHHTKEKGDLGVAKIIADLMEKGFKVLTPLSEHLPFDLVAYCPRVNKLYKIQCKYVTKNKGGVTIRLRTSYATSKGSVSSRYAELSFDVMAAYCPEVGKVYYVEEERLREHVNSFRLRVDPVDRPQKWENQHGFNYAEDYTNFPGSVAV